MGNQSNQENVNTENTSFYDQVGNKLSKGVTKDAQAQVRETEDASLQDNEYSFDESNTDNEEYHDAEELEEDDDDFDYDDDDDYVQ